MSVRDICKILVSRAEQSSDGNRYLERMVIVIVKSTFLTIETESNSHGIYARKDELE